MQTHEHDDQTSGTRSISLLGGVAMGTGVMIGAGIFALTGQIAELAGPLFPLSFIAGALVTSLARSAERDSVMATLSERYGLFYFFSATCGPCEVMSPIVKGVADRWRITVRAISTDGGPSRHFPDYKVETNQRARLGLEGKATPALVLWDSVTKRPIPIGYGVLSADELQNRIYLLTSKEAGHDF
ncbi:MAG: hypothetical protein E6R00_11925 [Gammaproteobacteria bacterium]|nr:MAG: hypothetical protein E6R00_11925 [Gammaproteobacteria bacterium]